MTNKTDDKRKTRYKILGELESIKHLLEEDVKPLEPPLLTDPVEDTEAPLLTDAWHEEEEEPADPDAEAFADADIPLLQEAIEEDERDEGQDEAGEREDIVSRALRQQRHRTLFDLPIPEAPSVAEASELPQRHEDENQEDLDPGRQLEKSEPKPEEQPGLFDAPSSARKEEAREDQPPTATGGERPAPDDDESDSPTQKKSENPFLPKHIRDRLNANRALQQEMIKGFTSPPFTPFPSARRNAPDDAIDEKLVEQLVQRYLPKIEVELREKLRELVKQERKQLEDPDQT